MRVSSDRCNVARSQRLQDVFQIYSAVAGDMYFLCFDHSLERNSILYDVEKQKFLSLQAFPNNSPSNFYRATRQGLVRLYMTVLFSKLLACKYSMMIPDSPVCSNR